jgi:hypothetical protein
VRWTNKCPSDYPLVVPHFTVTEGTICLPKRELVSPLASGKSRDFLASFGSGANASSWRSWIDDSTSIDSGTGDRTLVELTGTLEADVATFYLDISLVDALSNSIEVVPPAENCTQTVNSRVSKCQSISCVPAAGWQCPVQNRFDVFLDGKSYLPTYLSADQSCLSNCTVYQMDEACCRGEYANATTCSSSSPGLKQACGEAYSYAFDDASSTYVWSLPIWTDIIIEIVTCP